MTSLRDELGIAIIGSGFMARTYAETVARYNRRARLVGIAGGRRISGAALRGDDYLFRRGLRAEAVKGGQALGDPRGRDDDDLLITTEL